MKRFLAVAAALFVAAGSAGAEDKPFYLNRDGTVEQRLDTVTTEVEKLRAEFNEMKAALHAGHTVAVAKPQPKAAPESQQIVYQMCVNGRCTNYVTDDPAKVPFNAKIVSMSTAAVTSSPMVSGSPCPSGPCGDNCGCASASITVDDGWYLGKNLGRRRR